MNVGVSVVTKTDVIAVVGLFFCFPLVRWLLQALAFQPLATLLLSPRSSVQDKHRKYDLDSTTKKFCESQWKLATYGLFCVLGARACMGEDWAANSTKLYSGWPLQPISYLARQLYRLELGFYLSSIGMLALWEVRRKDSTVMMAHHWATVTLIGGSFYCNLFRVGCVTMLLHDATDVLMELAKLFNYLNMEVAATGAFAAFMAAWVILRLYLFPSYVIRSFVMEAPTVMGGQPPMYWLLSGLLGMLFVIHMYWFWFIAQIAWMKLTTGTGHDVREDED